MRYIPTVVVAFSCDFVVANPTLIKKLSNGHLPFLYALIIPWMCESFMLGNTPKVNFESLLDRNTFEFSPTLA